MYCKKCGGKIESYASHCPFCGEPVANNSTQATYSAPSNNMAREERTVGKWILTYIITGIPIIGFIMTCIWAFGSETKNDPTFRNWARANLIFYIIAIVMGVILAVVMLAVLGTIMENYPMY